MSKVEKHQEFLIPIFKTISRGTILKP